MNFKSWHFVILAMLQLSAPLRADTMSGRVVGITDGDTLVLLDANREQHKIRLSGIDAPEKAQPFGVRSKASLSALAFDQDVTANCPKKDRYGREVCVVVVRGKDIGLAQVADGMAWWYQKYAKQQTSQARVDYEAAEFSAKAKRVGLWADKDPVPPWDWRRAMRSK